MKGAKLPKRYQDLIRAAQKAKLKSHSPYSEFRVGAALLSRSGNVFTGCNIENSSFSLTICAERTALFKAVSESERQFTIMAVVSDAEEIVAPCGACRQVLSDLAGNIVLVLANRKGDAEVVRLRDLLPLPFTGKSLPHHK